MEQSFAASRREGIGLTLSDPAFFDAVILAKKRKPKLPFLRQDGVAMLIDACPPGSAAR
jgi:hypothetical protein